MSTRQRIALLFTPALLLVGFLASTPASAQQDPPQKLIQVSTEEELREAFLDPETTDIELLNNITLKRCNASIGEGEFIRPDRESAPLTIDGEGFTVDRDCTDIDPVNAPLSVQAFSERVFSPGIEHQFEVTYVVKNFSDRDFTAPNLALFDKGPVSAPYSSLVSTDAPAGVVCSTDTHPYWGVPALKCTLPENFSIGEKLEIKATVSIAPSGSQTGAILSPSLYTSDAGVSHTPLTWIFSLSKAVQNPGPFTAVGRSGFFKVGSQSKDFVPCREGFPEPVEGCPRMVGDIDSLGNMTVSSMTFPVATLEPIPGVEVEADLEVTIDNGYFFLPMQLNGTALLRISHPTLIPATCAVGPFPISISSTQNGWFLGDPVLDGEGGYDLTTGKAVLGDGLFEVPAASATGDNACGGVAGTINSLVGLPALTRNIISTNWQFSPVFIPDFENVVDPAVASAAANPNNDIYQTRVFASYNSQKLTLKNITVSDGYVTNQDSFDPSGTGFGGAVWAGGDVDIIGSTFTNNKALGGGAVYAEGKATVVESTFSNNEALEAAGGAILAKNGIDISSSEFLNNMSAYGGGAVAHNGDGVIADTIFTGNTALSFGGALLSTGGVPEGEVAPLAAEQPTVSITASNFSDNATSVLGESYGGAAYFARSVGTVTDATFTGNATGSLGGAIFVLGAAGPTGSDVPAPEESPLNVAGSTFTANTASGGETVGGGAIAAPDLTVSDSQFAENESDGYGGAIFSETLEVSSSAFSMNESGLSGGAIESGDISTIDNSTFDSNIAGTSGGAISQGGTSVTITKSTVDGNRALGGFGGGIRAYNTATIATDESTTTNNDAAQSGGGISANNGGVITNSIIEGNSATDGGGGVFAFGLTIQNSSLRGNSTSTFGGGVFGESKPGEPIIISYSTVSGNQAASGGGVAATSNSSLTMDNSTITNNTASEFGGGVFGGGQSTQGDFRFDFVTLVNNDAPQGANLSASVPVAANATVLSNPATAPNCLIATGGSMTGSYAYVSDNSCAPTGTGNIVNQGPAGLGDLQNNGGTTETRLPATNSALLNAVPTTTCETFLSYDLDQRGSTRPQQNMCDIGAVEGTAGPTPPPPPPPGPDPDVCSAGPTDAPLTSYGNTGSRELEAMFSSTPLIIGFSHTGTGIFKVTALNGAREQIGVLVNTTGKYSGTLPIQFEANQTGNPVSMNVKYLVVEADDAAPWEVKVWGITSAPEIEGRELTGGCDAVVVATELRTMNRSVTVRSEDIGPFSASAYSVDGATRSGLGDSTTGPFEQTTRLTDPLPLLTFSSRGKWSVSIVDNSSGDDSPITGSEITEVQQPRFTG